MHSTLHRIRRSRGLRIMTAFACLMLVLTSAPVMASSMAMPGMVHAASMQAAMPLRSMDNGPMPAGRMLACCQGQGGHASTTTCHCPVMCGCMLPTFPAMFITSGHVAVIHAPLVGGRGPAPVPSSPLRPPIA